MNRLKLTFAALFAALIVVVAPLRSARANDPYSWSLGGFAADGTGHTITGTFAGNGTFTVTFPNTKIAAGATRMTCGTVTISYAKNGTTTTQTTSFPTGLQMNTPIVFHTSKFDMAFLLSGGHGNYILSVNTPTVYDAGGPTPLPTGEVLLDTSSEVETVSLQVQLPYLVGRPVHGLYTYSDSSGLTESGSTYQWFRNHAPIPGATGTTYTLTGDDIGQQLMFCVTIQNDYTDGLNKARACMSSIIDQPDGLPANQFAITGDPEWDGDVTAYLQADGDPVEVGLFWDDSFSVSANNTTFGTPTISSTPSPVVIYTYSSSPVISYVIQGSTLTISP